MQRLIFLEFEDFANKLLADEDRKVLEGLEISLYIDRENRQIHREVYFSKVLSKEKIIEQEQVIQKFVAQLYQDIEIQRLMGMAKLVEERVLAG